MLTRDVRSAYKMPMRNLHEWMEANNENDATMAPKLGVSRVQVSRIRRRICRPSPGVAMKLEKITGIAASEFIFGEAA